MKKSDTAVTLVVYAITTLFLVMTLKLPPEAQTYPLALLTALYVLNTLFILSAYLKWRVERKMHDDLAEHFKGFLPKQFIGVIIGIIVYVVLLVTAGYYIATIAYLAGALLFLKVKKQWIVLVIAVLLAVIYPVFTLFLKVPLPKGMLFS